MKTCCVNNCKWPSWGKDKITGLPYCKFHQSLRTDTDKRTPFQKHMDKVKENVSKVPEADEKALQKWFEDKMMFSLRECENCGLSLRRYSENDWRGSQHHILEKSLYPSVGADPINHLVLGKWCCHPQWHTSWENAAKMKVWGKAVDIINILYPKLTRDERRKLVDIVVQEIKPEIYNR